MPALENPEPVIEVALAHGPLSYLIRVDEKDHEALADYEELGEEPDQEALRPVVWLFDGDGQHHDRAGLVQAYSNWLYRMLAGDDLERISQAVHAVCSTPPTLHDFYAALGRQASEAIAESDLIPWALATAHRLLLEELRFDVELLGKWAMLSESDENDPLELARALVASQL